MSYLVQPREHSYVLEWESVQFDGTNLGTIRKFLWGTGWMVQMDLTDNGAVIVSTRVQNGQIEQWKTEADEWIVKSPHGRLWFMGNEEFQSQFQLYADKV